MYYIKTEYKPNTNVLWNIVLEWIHTLTYCITAWG